MRSTQILFARAMELIERAENILCVSPELPDGDSVSSCAAFRLFLSSRKKFVALWCVDPIPTSPLMRSLPGVEAFNARFPDTVTWDLVVAFDYGDTERLHLPIRIAESVPLLGFDHHASATFRGRRGLSVIDAKSSSTTLLLYKFFRAMKHPISSDLAWCLLVGLGTDTQFFRNSLATPEAFRAASELMRKGASLARLSELMSPQYSRKTIIAWREALGRLEVFGNTAFLVTTEDYMRERNFSYRDFAGAVNALLIYIKDIHVLATITAEHGEWRGSLRSPSGAVNVAEIAELFGGGGHASAAGFISSLPPEEIKQKISEYANYHTQDSGMEQTRKASA